MGSELRLRKALMQADRGDVAAAVVTTRSVAAESGPSPLQARALVVLGDLLVSQGDPDAARSALTEALAVIAGLDEDADDLLAFEAERARELLGALG